MNISGVLIQALPGQISQVQSALSTLDGVIVHATSASGQCVVTVEHDDAHYVADTIAELHRLQGVLSAAMVYQYGDDEEEH